VFLINRPLSTLIGIVNTFLSWGFFSPLARISYMTYLIHFDLLWVFFHSANYAMEMSNLALVTLHSQVFLVLASRQYVGMSVGLLGKAG
jgi:hypothetical protein